MQEAVVAIGAQRSMAHLVVGVNVVVAEPFGDTTLLPSDKLFSATAGWMMIPHAQLTNCCVDQLNP